jgi:hypothetical protein
MLLPLKSPAGAPAQKCEVNFRRRFAILAAANKCLAQSSKSGTEDSATKKYETWQRGCLEARLPLSIPALSGDDAARAPPLWCSRRAARAYPLFPDRSRRLLGNGRGAAAARAVAALSALTLIGLIKDQDNGWG